MQGKPLLNLLRWLLLLLALALLSGDTPQDGRAGQAARSAPDGARPGA